MSDSIVSYQPTDGLCYDPRDARYWDEDLLNKEVVRVFEVCHGCRMCFKYCDSFPDLFSLLDDKHDGDVRKLSDDDVRSVMDGCFQCKLCEVQCPYTPRDGHEFQLDFPKLVHRYAAIQAKKQGLSLRDRLLGAPDTLAKWARASFGLANRLNKVSLHRWFTHTFLGIHRHKWLPEFVSTTFESWAEGEGLCGESEREVVVFATCYVNNHTPQVGKDTVDVLQRNGVDVGCAKGAGCCGMPKWESGDLDGVRAQAKILLDALDPHVQRGAKIAVSQPTCAMMLRRELPGLVEDSRAERLADAIVDPGEYLWSIRKEERFNTDFKSVPPGGAIAYHAPCHLRAQAVGFRGRDLMRKTGAKIHTVMECCGHDGTYAMKVEGFEPSQRIGKKSFDDMTKGGATVWASECSLASLQFAQHAGKASMHPMSVLARAYREDGFSDMKPSPSSEPSE